MQDDYFEQKLHTAAHAVALFNPREHKQSTELREQQKRATPETKPISSNFPWRLAKRQLATVSFATNRSSQPSLLMSQATTPHALAMKLAMPVSLLTSVKVPSPLLRKSQQGMGS